jgi:electron transfer flavoprotein alpha subunit
VSGVLIVAEHRQGELRAATLELVTAAQELRAGAGGPVAVAVIAPKPEQHVAALSLAGVDEIVTVPVVEAEFEPDTYEAAVGALIASRRPRIVLLLHSVDSMGYGAAVAARGGLGFATDVFKIEYQDAELIATRGGYGQKVNVELEFPGKQTVVLALRGNVFKPPQAGGSPKVVAFTAPAVAPRSKSREFIAMSSADDVDMATAEFILAIGRGIGEEANVAKFRELADALGATLGCSRPIADAGWLPKSRQVGQSGKTAGACKLYLAMGISGAIQHLAGMKHVSTIIAVNADAGASIFSVAKYGVVADIFEIADELRKHF